MRTIVACLASIALPALGEVDDLSFVSGHVIDIEAPPECVQLGQLEGLRRYVETGSPIRESETGQ